MTLNERLQVMTQLGEQLAEPDDFLRAVMHRTYVRNNWFTTENQEKAIKAIAYSFLSKPKMSQWLNAYSIPEENRPKTIGLVMAGNIPLVGFHDVLSVFMAGHRSLIKLSDKDQFLLPQLIKMLEKIDARTSQYFETTNAHLKGFDAIIATGSNNSARYFEAYFGKYPNIIRKNRNGIGVLTGEETDAELLGLGQDIFQYFGLGCRNVSKLYVPEGYNFEPLMEILRAYKDVVLHNKYKNNFDYNYSLYILNKVEFKSNGCILFKEDESLQSRIGSLHYEYFKELNQVSETISQRKEEIQCIVTKGGMLDTTFLEFGKTQSPELWDYPDGVDTMDFLLAQN